MAPAPAGSAGAGGVWTWRDGPVAPGPAVLVDIDGVLADAGHRLHFVRQRPRDWNAFFDAAADDPPLPAALRLLEVLDADLVIVLVTGRPARLRDLTVDWLACHGARWDLLAMRPPDDRSAASNLKRRTLDALRAAGWEPRLAIDDDEEVVAAYGRAGLPCFRAGFAPG
jgi:HAD superfamily, subfamily IIIB (Acid phosphatase)